MSRLSEPRVPVFHWLVLLVLICLSSQQHTLRVEAARRRFLSHTGPYDYGTGPSLTVPPGSMPPVTVSQVSSAPFVVGSPAPTFASNSLPPTAVPLAISPTEVPASPSPTQSNYVSATQCPGQYACAPTGGVNAFNDSVVGPQCYPFGVYLDMNLQPINLTAPCIPQGNDAVALQCPVQYDAPQSHGAGVQDNVCYVYDPFRAELPWAASSAAYAQCYNPVEATCTSTNFLCPVEAPYACGRACFSALQYQCIVNPSNFFLSQLMPVSSSLSTESVCPGQPINNACTTPS